MILCYIILGYAMLSYCLIRYVTILYCSVSLSLSLYIYIYIYTHICVGLRRDPGLPPGPHGDRAVHERPARLRRHMINITSAL